MPVCAQYTIKCLKLVNTMKKLRVHMLTLAKILNDNVRSHDRGLDDMTASKRHSGFFKVVNLSEMVGCLEDLITYFAQPEEELSKLLLSHGRRHFIKIAG